MYEWKEQDPHCLVDPITRLGMQSSMVNNRRRCQRASGEGRPVKFKKIEISQLRIFMS